MARHSNLKSLIFPIMTSGLNNFSNRDESGNALARERHFIKRYRHEKALPGLCGKILIDKIHVKIDGLSGNHRHKSHLVATALTFRQDHSGSNGDQMRHAVGIMMDPINTRARSNSTRRKTRR